MFAKTLSLATLLATSSVIAQTTVLTGTATGPLSGDEILPSTGLTYISYNTTRTLSTTSTGIAVSFNATNQNATNPAGIVAASVAPTITYLSGDGENAQTGIPTSTSAAATAVNTQPCNGYPEFCNRKYSNITHVAAHNFCFVKPGNAASNQVLGVVDQLNDGVRMLQAQTHLENGTLYFCHTSCDLLNVGTIESHFTQIRQWVDAHPYDVVTILLGNANRDTPVEMYIDPITNSGLKNYAYIPPQIPMTLDAWPTLGQLIITGKRVIIFMDYYANQDSVPYVLDEFSQMWETPYSPTDPAFPCTRDRPPGLTTDQAHERLYLANHNLNADFNLLGLNLLLPNTALINQTNAESGNGSLGLMANRCEGNWGRAPNFLLVDYYNYGDFPGSVFQVAATHNNVTYNRDSCCRTTGQSVAPRSVWAPTIGVFLPFLFALFMM